MSRERRAEAEASVIAVDGETPDQQGGNRVRSMAAQGYRGVDAVDRGHRNAGVSDNGVTRVGDDPRCCCVATSILAGVSPQPVVERSLTRFEPGACVARGVEQGRALVLNQSRRTRAAVVELG
jgi:hypothetical protein